VLSTVFILFQLVRPNLSITRSTDTSDQGNVSSGTGKHKSSLSLTFEVQLGLLRKSIDMEIIFSCTVLR
jgi:hypothetical protein